MIMATNFSKLRICLVAGILLLLLGKLLFAAFKQAETVTAGEECIRCHVSILNQGLENRELHAPFWERQCVVCHLPSGVTWPPNLSSKTTSQITGTVVSQDNLWRKVQLYSADSGEVFDHQVSIPQLEMNTAYRFRIVVSTSAKEAGGKVYRQPWLGLRPTEVINLGDRQQIDFGPELSISVSKFIKTAFLFRDGNKVSIFWESTQPFYGWVEVQELEGLTLTDLTTTAAVETPQTVDSEQHPPLRTPEELAIDACYQCHPESTLGTSHPVRLYGGQDVSIPDDLPTVDGMLTCVTCHNPHGSAGKMLVREVIKTKLCVACHYKYKNSSPSTMFQ